MSETTHTTDMTGSDGTSAPDQVIATTDTGNPGPPASTSAMPPNLIDGQDASASASGQEAGPPAGDMPPAEQASISTGAAGTPDPTASPSPSPLAPDESAGDGTTDADTGTGTVPTVPLTRFQSVQRLLSRAERNLNQAQKDRDQAQKDCDHYKELSGSLQQRLAAADGRAAVEYAERIKATCHDIVPELIRGETVEQVEQALAASRAAFAAARAAYARMIPTPGSGTTGTAGRVIAAGGVPGSPVDMISRGLHQTSSDINQ